MAGYIGTQAVSVNTTSATITGDASIGGNVTLNEGSADVDFRVESVAGEHSLFVEGSTGNIGMFGDAGVQAIDHYSAYTTLTLGNTVGGTIQFENDGVAIGQVFNTADDFVVESTKADGDVLIKGNDGGSSITALSLDMSAAGEATFNSNVRINGDSGTLFFNRNTSAADVARIQYVNGNPSFDIGADGKNVRIINGGSFAETVRFGTNGDVTIQDGNLVVANTHGISFAATGNGSGSSQNELLDDYEEGTWAATGNGITLADQVSRYVKIGNIVHVGCKIVFPTTSNTGLAQINGFPFASVDSQAARAGLVVSFQDEGSSNGLQILVGTNAANAQLYLGSATKSNANMSGHTVFFGGTYLSDN